MKASLLIFIVISSFLVSLHQCGHIFSQPSEILPQNAQAAYEFHFFFMLETQVIAGDYLFIKFPMNIASSTPASAAISTNMDPKFWVSGVQGTTAGGVALSSSVDTRFYLLSQTLSANTWYRVQVNITDASTQTVGVQGCVWMATTSSNQANYITYDENRCIDVLSFAPLIDTPSSAFIVKSYMLFNNKNNYWTIGGTYGANFDITPSKLVDTGALFKITLPGDFTFVSPCSSISCLKNDGNTADYCPDSNLTALPSSAYTCSVDTGNAAILVVKLTQSITTYNTFRITANIQNPSRVVSGHVNPKASFESAKAYIIFAKADVTSGSNNGLSLTTDFPTPVPSFAGSNKLLWGVAATSAAATARAGGYVGCPVALYISATNIIYNSLQTTFTPGAYKGLSAHNNIQAVWTLLSAGTIASIIKNSFYHTFTGTSTTVAFAADFSTVTIAGLTEITASPITLGIKFSMALAAVGASANAIVSTISSSGTPTVGAVSIKTGDGAKSYATVGGSQIPVKLNFEYDDSTISAAGDGDIKYYNQVFSYWSGHSNYDFSTKALSATTFNKYFLGKTAATGAAAAVWSKPTATINQGVFIQLVFAATAVCVASSTDYGMTINAACNGGTAPNILPDIAVLLKIVFNNNVLGIPDADYFKGAKVIGDLFSGAVANTDYTDYLSTRSAASSNMIAKDNTLGIWHLSIVCKKSGTGGAAANSDCFSALAYAVGVTVSGVAFPNTVVSSTKYPSMYADANVLDFLICIKIAQLSAVTSIATVIPTEDNWKLVEEGCTSGATCTASTIVAGPGIINGYVVSGGVLSSAVRTSVVMGYLGATATIGYSTAAIKSYFPAYLRVGCTISAPMGSGTNVGVFVGGPDFSGSVTFFSGLATYLDDKSNINVLDVGAGATSAGTVVQGYTTYSATALDHWWVQHAIIFPATVSSGGTAAVMNYYIPIQVSFSSITTLNVAILGAKANGVYPVNAVYRVFGSVLSNELLQGTPAFGTLGAVFDYAPTANADTDLALVISGENVIADSSGNLAMGSTKQLWDIGYAAGTTTGCFAGAQAVGTVRPIAATGSGGSFLPSKTIATTFNVDSPVATPAGAKCKLDLGNALVPNAPATTLTTIANSGQAFVIYTREPTNIFSAATLTWAYTPNKCYHHTVNIMSGATVKSIFTVFCEANVLASGSYGGASKTVLFSTFTVPFYWGNGYALYNKIQYAWSNQYGLLAALNGDYQSTAQTASAWGFQNDCSVNDNLAIAQNTYDATFKVTLTTSNGVLYNLNPSEYLSLSFSNGIPAGSFYSCQHSVLACSFAGTTMKLTNAGTSAVAPGGFSMDVWADTTTAGTTNTYFDVEITFNGNTNSIEKCKPLASTGGWQVAGNALDNFVTVNEQKNMVNVNARGAWSLSFGYTRIFRKTYDFLINVGAMGSAIKENTNYRCLILQSSGGISNNFATITPISATYDTTITSKIDYASGGTFTLQCIGANMPKADFATAKAMGYVERSGGTKITQLVPEDKRQLAIKTPEKTEAPAASVALTKFFNTRGFDSDYIFSFKPTSANYTNAGRILVEFSRSIPPKLNKYGVLECYLNETPVFCEFLNERRVLVWPNINLQSTVLYNYVLRIAGVTQPNNLAATVIDQDTNKQIYFAISAGDNPDAGITEASFVTEVWDPAAAASTIASILIHDFQISNSKFRATSTFTYVLNMPANSLTTEDSIIWVQLPGTLSKSIYYGSSPTFTLTRVYDSTNTNLAKRSLVMRGRRIAVFVKADAVNAAAANYTLTINGLSTPVNPSAPGFVRDDFRIWTSADNVTVAASTAAGARNSTKYISWDVGTLAAGKVLNWYDPQMNMINTPVDVTIGTYKTLVFLSSGVLFTNTFNFSAGGSNSSVFSTQPRDPAYPIRAVLGSTAAPVYLSAKTGTAQGLYYLSWTGTDNTGYSALPNLDLKVVSKNCTPTLSGTTFDVPYGGGTSDPIILDFSQCIPASDVTVTANVTVGYNTSSDNGISFSQQQTSQSSLTFTDMNGNYKVAFYATSNPTSNGTAGQTGVATIAFTMTGTNGVNIDAPATVAINMVVASTIAPVPMTPSISATNQLGVGCDMKGTNYFSFATFSNAASYNITYIASITQSVKVSLTKPDQNDPTYAVFGYVSGLTPSTLSTVNLGGYLKAGSNLTVYSYCMSNSLVSSTAAASLSWIQPDNGGATVVLKATFKSPLSSDHKTKFACALVKALVISSRLVLTDEGQWCKTLRVLQGTTNSTNTTTNTTTTPTTNTTNTTNASTATYTSYWYVLKNYLATSDNTSTLLNAQILSSTFLPGLISSIGDATFPTLASNLFVATTVSTSGTNSSIVPVVSYINSLTNTYSINATFNLSNTNGMVYAGVEADVVNATAIPNVTNLILGLNGKGTKLAASNYAFVSAGGQGIVNLTGLVNNTKYILYYAANNMDISINGMFSSVGNVSVSTNSPNGNFGSIMRLSLMVLAALFLALFGMI